MTKNISWIAEKGQFLGTFWEYWKGNFFHMFIYSYISISVSGSLSSTEVWNVSYRKPLCRCARWVGHKVKWTALHVTLPVHWYSSVDSPHPPPTKKNPLKLWGGESVWIVAVIFFSFKFISLLVYSNIVSLLIPAFVCLTGILAVSHSGMVVISPSVGMWKLVKDPLKSVWRSLYKIFFMVTVGPE